MKAKVGHGSLAVSAAALLALLAVGCGPEPAIEGLEIDADDIGGVVTGANGPEAGVWVVAEAQNLPTRFVRAVVTDDQGRFVVPDLPDADYRVWARGYGLVDTAKAAARPGRTLRLTARAAANEAEAAAVYPAAYWYAMLKIPAKADFAPENRRAGISAEVTSQEEWLYMLRATGCVGCHQMGNLATRTLPEAYHGLDSTAAWTRRIQAGQAGEDMMTRLMTGMGPLGVQLFADWSDRIAAGETPSAKPERPQGVERNIVVTVWDWTTEKHYLHDLISTDRRNPTVNGYGLLYGASEFSTDAVPILDPVRNVATSFQSTVRDPDTPIAARAQPLAPSPYWGAEAIWDSRTNIHNPMFDQHGRVWLTAIGRRAENNPDFCRNGSDHPSARAFPTQRSNRQLALLDPKTQAYTFLDTCYSTHHLQFDANDVLWTSGGGPVVGWFDMREYDRSGDAARAQGWTPLILDTNGNGRRDDFVEPGAPAEPGKDRRIDGGFYAVMPNPADGSVWGAAYRYPGSVFRLEPGPDPSRTALTEIYNVPLPGYGTRGADIDSQGVVWVSLSSGHLGEFDRRKCRGPLNGPTATGDHCPEGWTLHRLPGPTFAEGPDESVGSTYYTWVDQHDTLGLGRDVPVVTANLYDGLQALVDGRFITLRVPYPMGFYAKGLDGRIDDPNAGWKGRGLWTTSGDRTPWHMEGGKGNKPLVVHFQARPDPLAH